MVFRGFVVGEEVFFVDGGQVGVVEVVGDLLLVDELFCVVRKVGVGLVGVGFVCGVLGLVGVGIHANNIIMIILLMLGVSF